MDDKLEQELDITKLRYVLYARKSTTDETRQVRSIDDQIADCELLAKRIGIRVVKVLRETQSAKKPGKRPIFTQMIKDIRSGVYDGILAWNPDRLARNMLEGGGLIDMIDTNVIKDLKFVTHHFTKDANGKMLLGMAFVLSKQYSDSLSQNVKRGVRYNFSEGKSPAPKHGYMRDENGMYVPDGKNFELICEAWQMRQEGKSLEIIAKHLNDNGYGRVVKSTGRVILMTADILSTQVFCNPFYYGILISETTGNSVDLREAYEFVPATTEDIYNEVQTLSYNRKTPMQTHRRKTYYPLKAMVRCAFCNHNMVVGASTGKSGKRYLNYRCDNDTCRQKKLRIDPKTGREKRSIRAKFVFNYIYEILEKGLHLTDTDYDEYYGKLGQLSDEKRAKLQMQIHSKQGSLKILEKEAKDRSLGVMLPNVKENVRKYNEERIDELEDLIDTAKDDILKLQKKIIDPEQDKLSREQFLNISKNAATAVKSGSEIAKDVVCRIIFLNFSAGVDEMLSYQAKPLFDELLKRGTFSSGRRRGN